jgi:hypothetical protein
VTRFYIVENCPEFDEAWDEIQERTKSYHEAAREVGVSVGANAWATNLERGLVSGFRFKPGSEPDLKLWTYNKKHATYFPRRLRANKELLARCEKLPKVDYEELHTLLRWKGYCGTNLNYHFGPGVKQLKKKKAYLVHTDYGGPEWKTPKFCRPLTWEEGRELLND